MELKFDQLESLSGLATVLVSHLSATVAY